MSRSKVETGASEQVLWRIAHFGEERLVLARSILVELGICWLTRPGRERIPPQGIPGVGRFCGISSPQGVMFYAIRYSS